MQPVLRGENEMGKTETVTTNMLSREERAKVHEAALMGSLSAIDQLAASHNACEEVLLLAQAEVRRLKEAMLPFKRFADAFDAKPINGLDKSEIYSIHGGDRVPPYGATLCWEHIRRVQQLLNQSLCR